MSQGKNTRQIKLIACAEGMTLNGFPVEREHIEQMAKDYDPKFYCGRVNLDHIKSLFPDSQFRSYSMISAVNTVELTEGELKGKLGLEVTIDIDDLKDEYIVNLNKSGQKIFSSIEYYPSFPQTKRAYLTGVALTDYPAAIGSRPIELSAASRGLPDSGNYFTASLETQCHLLNEQHTEHQEEKEASKKFLSTVKQWLGLERNHNSEETTNLKTAIELTAQQCGTLLTENEAQKQALSQLTNDFNALKQQLAVTDGSGESRPQVSGGSTKLAEY
ncbi:GPO family capsid scaffolding protein [Providencia sp. wls1950]|uniref:GPO family capsid scaffolding protein n=1 Tax=Providencia sp. wls1950 TaxID=2675147 RepID=UPI0012B648F1|nr:GPO family capsid scaffolding protein [Providencia sp. wls1950]MTB44171.1 phage capsid protein [Providencia sp. wls1950]